jgi:membrane protease YdiL (CAAX protease family)
VLAFAAVKLLPALPAPANRDMGIFLESGAGHDLLSGSWGWLAVILVMGILNTVLGEELLFRGLLLPRMHGVFGRWDWAANGVLFALYHLHVPWVIPHALLDAFLLAYPAKRYRSALIAIAVHSAQTVVISILVLALVLR